MIGVYHEPYLREEKGGPEAYSGLCQTSLTKLLRI